jgi:hypothetical protein
MSRPLAFLAVGREALAEVLEDADAVVSTGFALQLRQDPHGYLRAWVQILRVGRMMRKVGAPMYSEAHRRAEVMVGLAWRAYRASRSW